MNNTLKVEVSITLKAQWIFQNIPNIIDFLIKVNSQINIILEIIRIKDIVH